MLLKLLLLRYIVQPHSTGRKCWKLVGLSLPIVRFLPKLRSPGNIRDGYDTDGTKKSITMYLLAIELLMQK